MSKITENERLEKVKALKLLFLENGFKERSGFSLAEVVYIKDSIKASIFYNICSVQNGNKGVIVPHECTTKMILDFINNQKI